MSHRWAHQAAPQAPCGAPLCALGGTPLHSACKVRVGSKSVSHLDRRTLHVWAEAGKTCYWPQLCQVPSVWLMLCGCVSQGPLSAVPCSPGQPFIVCCELIYADAPVPVCVSLSDGIAQEFACTRTHTGGATHADQTFDEGPGATPSSSAICKASMICTQQCIGGQALCMVCVSCCSPSCLGLMPSSMPNSCSADIISSASRYLTGRRTTRTRGQTARRCTGAIACQATLIRTTHGKATQPLANESLCRTRGSCLLSDVLSLPAVVHVVPFEDFCCLVGCAASSQTCQALVVNHRRTPGLHRQSTHVNAPTAVG